VAHTLGNNGSDQNQFAPLLDAIKTNLGSNPHEVSADAGYCSALRDGREAFARKSCRLHVEPCPSCSDQLMTGAFF
jgi:hypothetical protein